MISMESTKASLLVTDRHRMLYKERFSNKDYEYGLAKDFLKIGKKRFYIPKTGEWKCNGTKSDKITVNMDFGYHFNKKSTPNTFFTRDYMEFMGWYISEGHARESGEVRFYNSNKKDLNRYLNLTKKMGFKR